MLFWTCNYAYTFLYILFKQLLNIQINTYSGLKGIMLSLLCLQVHNAANSNQKEKYEADLKKEIKKLQVSSLSDSCNYYVCYSHRQRRATKIISYEETLVMKNT